MKLSKIALADLPDELILMIFKKLNNVQLLYSLMGLNTQLDRVLSDRIFTNDLTLFTYILRDRICSLDNTVLDRFCSQILPRIQHQISHLHLQCLSVERVLLAVDYPRLHDLHLHNIDPETAERIFSDESSLFDIFNKKIDSLTITMTIGKPNTSAKASLAKLFTRLFTVFSNLLYLNYQPYCEPSWLILSFFNQTPIFFSSTLVELRVRMNTLDDCFYLLDGRLSQLRLFDVDILFVDCPLPPMQQMDTLRTLTSFSLTSKTEMYQYETSLVPFVQAMINLEKLVLNICVHQIKLVDGNQLKNHFSIYLSRLKTFNFNIRSIFADKTQRDSLSNENLQSTFAGLGIDPVVSYVDKFHTRGRCHYFSYPYRLRYCDDITNQFPDGLFECVREISLYDERPFEYDFFLRIAKIFPLVEILSVNNEMPQQQKINKKSMLIVEYPHLVRLNFLEAHHDYIEQFLTHTRTSYPNNIQFWTDYECLEKATRHFKKKIMRVNGSKITHLHFYDDSPVSVSKRLKKYFPHARMYSYHSPFQ